MDFKTILKFAGYLLVAVGVIDLILFYSSGMETYIIPPVIVFAGTDWTTYAVMILGGAMASASGKGSSEEVTEDLFDE
tara:strand:- start:2833 stop:3066 length:234 start_codon:yes stop_codon:yes gene_type:complete